MEKVCNVSITFWSINLSKTRASVYTKQRTIIWIMLKKANDKSNQFGINIPSLFNIFYLKSLTYG
jgi:hypothetical protein